jgi:hypothetical protein
MGTSTKHCGTGGQVIVSGGGSWSNPGNILSSNNSYATLALNFAASPNNFSNFLAATNFDFVSEIPSGAIIKGITVSVKCKENNAAGDVVIDAFLTKNGTTDLGSGEGSAELSTSDAVVTFGGASDLWGLTFTAAEVNAAGFGVLLMAIGNAGYNLSVDDVSITIDWELGGRNNMIMF